MTAGLIAEEDDAVVATRDEVEREAERRDLEGTGQPHTGEAGGVR